MNVILIADPRRPDIYNYLLKYSDCVFYMLWFEKPNGFVLNNEAMPVKLIYWQDFLTPAELIKKLKPDTIVFFSIIDLRQIALIVYSNSVNVNTCYIDHGAANDKNSAIERFAETTFIKNKLSYLIKRFFTSFSDIFYAKAFYYSVINGHKHINSYLKYMVLPLNSLLSSPVEVLNKFTFKSRVPKKSIIFNRGNFEEYSLYTGATENDVIFTGVPYFDSYFKNDFIEERYIVYIDHPYLEGGLNSWTSEFHEDIANVLFDFSKKHKIKIYIKLHPNSNIAIWNSYSYNSEYIEILQQGNYVDLYLKSQLILSFSSSLLTGFLCAKKNVVLLGWHPNPFIFGMDFSKTGLCHVSYNPKDLELKYDQWINNNLAINNEDLYNSFLKEYNHPFDGKATDRIIKIVTNV